MDHSNWLFDNQQHQQSFQNDHFLSFDSPSHNSEHLQPIIHTPNDIEHDGRSSSGATSSTNNTIGKTPTEQNTSDQEYHNYLNVHIDVLGPLNQTNGVHQKQHNVNHQIVNGTEANNWSDLPDLNDIDMNFFPGDLAPSEQLNEQNNNHQNHLRHSSISNHLSSPAPQFTETGGFPAHNHTSFMQSFESPVVDNISSAQLNSIRPEVVFTPLVSPAVTPMDSFIHKNQQIGTSSGGFFSPLTSPALEAKSPGKLKKSSSPDESSSSTIASSTVKKYSKRKTPGNTPIVGPTIPGRIAKGSPVIKARRSSYVNNISYYQHQQQKSSNDNDIKIQDNEIMAPPKPRRTRQKSSTAKSSATSTPLLSADKGTHNDNSNGSNSAGNSHPATPATLMNFRVEQPSRSSSPVILPSNGTITSTSDRKSSLRSSTATIVPKRSSSLTSVPLNDSFEADDSQETGSSKKTSHKLAEQGRRNRMNQAIQDLSDLIPEELTASVTVPSKATTVELASDYIKTLLGEIEILKQNLNHEMVSNDSISPLESTIFRRHDE